MSNSIGLFSTVAPNDSLQFWKGNVVDLQKVRDFVNLNSHDVARIAGVPKSSVRFDSRVPPIVKEHMEAIANICNLVYQFFDSDVKTRLWLQTPNPMLGNTSPRDMIRFGRYKKLLKFVTDALEDEAAIRGTQEEKKIA